MIMNDFDDERTMEEEEAMEAEDEADELSALEQEQVGFTFYINVKMNLTCLSRPQICKYYSLT
jgi:hypothetical protein